MYESANVYFNFAKTTKKKDNIARNEYEQVPGYTLSFHTFLATYIFFGPL